MCGDSGTYRNNAYTCVLQAGNVKSTSSTSFRFAAQPLFSRPLLATQSCLCLRQQEPGPGERHAFSGSPAAMGARVTSSRQGDPSFSWLEGKSRLALLSLSLTSLLEGMVDVWNWKARPKQQFLVTEPMPVAATLLTEEKSKSLFA